MKKKFTRCRMFMGSVLCLVCLNVQTTTAQNSATVHPRNCGQIEHENYLRAKNPFYDIEKQAVEKKIHDGVAKFNKKKLSGAPQLLSQYTIPIVIHVVYANASENLSDALVLSAVTQLNQDWSRTNSDAGNTPAAFLPVAVDMQIQFCLATIGPDGAPTNGIVHKSTTVSSFSTDDAVKSTAQGGDDPWDVNTYLNIWVCNLGSGLLGYGEFPPVSPSYGTVVNYTTVGSLTDPNPTGGGFAYGRTLSHEIGHCFALYHTWGDDGNACSGSDQCADTPNQAGSTGGCPSGVQTDACAPNAPGIQYQNYMDYTDDMCYNMFSADQRTRCQNAISNYLMTVANNAAAACSIVPPIALDAGIIAVTAPAGNICDSTITPTVKIKNYGSATLTTCTINYKIDNNPVQTQSWSGSLATSQSAVVTLSSMTVSSGAHTFTCFTSSPNGGSDGNTTNDQSVSSLNVSSIQTPTTTGASACATPSVVTLSATGGGTLYWYSAPSGGAAVNNGNSFTTPSLSSTTTYYVESQNGGTTGNVGPATTTVFGGGSYHNNTSTQYLKFTVLQSCTLLTALVNSGAAGTRNLIVWDSLGTQLQSIPVAFPNGTGTATLNISLTPGSYRIGGTAMNLWRNNTGGTYPFSLSGVINITGSSAGPVYYYYIYDWLVQTTGCTSARIPVTATIGGMAVNYSPAKDTICTNEQPLVLTGGTPAGGTYSGAGVSSGSFNPTTAGVGDHTITYSYTDSSGCSGSATHNINVHQSGSCNVGINSFVNGTSGIALYPNPTDGSFTLETAFVKNETVRVEVLNTIGQIILFENHNLVAGNNKLSLQLNGVAKGVYFVKVKTPSGVLIQRIVKK